jgi:protein-tyrosine phosphatase
MFGRKLSGPEAEQLVSQGPLSVIDLTAESNAPVAFRERADYHNLPLLDLVPLKPEHVSTALDLIRASKDAGRRVYIHCQLGLQRSALIAAHWLAGQEGISLEAAKQKVREIEPRVVL